MKRPARVLRTGAKRHSIEPLAELREHQDDDRFDAIKIDPVVLSDDGSLPWRPSRYGYFLIVGAIIGLIT